MLIYTLIISLSRFSRLEPMYWIRIYLFVTLFNVLDSVAWDRHTANFCSTFKFKTRFYLNCIKCISNSVASYNSFGQWIKINLNMSLCHCVSLPRSIVCIFASSHRWICAFAVDQDSNEIQAIRAQNSSQNCIHCAV